MRRCSLSLVDQTANKELCCYEKVDMYAGNTVIVAMLIRDEEKWYFFATDEEFYVPNSRSFASAAPDLERLVWEAVEDLANARDFVEGEGEPEVPMSRRTVEDWSSTNG